MKKISTFICVNLWLIFLFVSISAQDFKTIQNGIEYAEMTREIDKTTVKMNLLRLDLTKVRLDVVHAMDAAIGLEKTSSIATRHGALAAINGGFFRIDKSIFEGDDVGALRIDGKTLSESHDERIALMILNRADQTEVNFRHLNLGSCFEVKKSCFGSGINRQRKEDDSVIFTPEFNTTTLTPANGAEIVVRRGKIFQILDRKGSTAIPSDGFVYSVSGKKREELMPRIKVGMKAQIGITNSVFNEPFLPKSQVDGNLPFISTAEDIVSGVPQLIKNGKIEITWEQEKTSKAFVETKHPRTAVAKLKDGKFLMVTVDGRSEASGGIGLEDLAKMLLELGATDAMNLDGGGSTTMFLDGKIVNKPSDKEGERKVGDAILVFPRKR